VTWKSGLGNSRSLKMAPFDSQRTTYYQSAIVTIVLSCIISEIKRDNGGKSRFFRTPAFYTPVMGASPPLGGLCRNIAIPFSVRKVAWCGYPVVKNLEDKFTRFDKYERDGQTNRHRTTA